MTEEERLKQEILFSKADSTGLAIVLMALMVEYAKTIGGDHKIALARVRTILERSLSKAKLKSMDAAGKEHDVSDIMKNRVEEYINQAEDNALRLLKSEPVRSPPFPRVDDI